MATTPPPAADADTETLPAHHDPAPGDDVLRLENVTRTFGNTAVLHDVDCTITAGDFAAVTGASGSGKSTMLNLMGLLDTPTTGEIYVAGHPTSPLTDGHRSALRGQHIGFVFQSFHLINTRTTTENVELGMLYHTTPRHEVAAAAAHALDQVGLAHRANATPATLSGGERQRVAIARAIAASPSVLLADEPTGNLDTTNSHHIMNLLDELNATGLTIIIVTHEPDIAARTRRHLHMTDGTLTEKTTP